VAELTDQQVYLTIGEAGFSTLVGAFYRRVRSDDLLSHLYPPDDFDAAERRLREFLIQRFGGPTRYSETRGHPRLRMRHAPFKVDRAARDRWIALMDAALVETQLPANISSLLRNYFDDTATFMINHHT
jgi:hemoglobin